MTQYSITSLFSGSKGNSVLIESEDAKILIDAGKSARAICSSLAEIGSSIDEIDAIFITHEHTDHVGALEVLLKKHKIPVHIVGTSATKLLSGKLFEHRDLICTHAPLFTVTVGGMTVRSFPTPHDSEYSVGYVIEIDGARIGYATDIGHVSNEIRSALTGCESVVLECNYDLQMLMEGPYPYDLKLRIRSDRGHLSNEACSAFASDLCLSGTKHILLAHLSEENNDPSLAFNEVLSAIGNESIDLKVASQYETVKLI